MPKSKLPFSLLERLTNAVAVSGDEGEVRKIVLEEINPFVDEVKTDALGNVLAVKRGRGKKRLRVMIAAHMDEVGFMLVDKAEKGIFRFETVGGVDPRQLVGKPVWVGKKHVPGVIGAKPIHLTKPDETERKIPVEALRIDVGLGNASVNVGDRAAFATKFRRIGPSIRAKALDDRLGVATLIHLLKNPPENVDILAAFTVQEEVGLRGARVAAYAMNPDVAFVLDATPAYDMPHYDEEKENVRYNTQLDAGPAIYVADGATLSDPRLLRHLQETADAEKIPYQIRQPGGGGTDAGAIHRARAGVPSVSISVPTRYLHTAMSLCRAKDWENTIHLLSAALSRLSPRLLENPR
jgi:endoglucanase